MNNELTEFQQQKLAAIDLLKTRYEGKADTLKDIDPRLDEYFRDLIAHSNANPDSPDDHHNVYELLGCYLGIAVGDGMLVTREFNLEQFCRIYGFFPTMLVGALDLLDKAGYIEYSDEDDASSRLRINVARQELFRALDPSGEQLILSILRRYGGIFVDYVYIDEDLLSSETGLTGDEIYQILLRLSQLHLVSFIPRKHMPRVTFRQRRVDKEAVRLSPQIYQERRQRYEQRIAAMLQYAEAEVDCCRSRQLLRYFGEEAEQDCGICDVCLRRKAQPPMPRKTKPCVYTSSASCRTGLSIPVASTSPASAKVMWKKSSTVCEQTER